MKKILILLITFQIVSINTYCFCNHNEFLELNRITNISEPTEKEKHSHPDIDHNGVHNFINNHNGSNSINFAQLTSLFSYILSFFPETDNFGFFSFFIFTYHKKHFKTVPIFLDISSFLI